MSEVTEYPHGAFCWAELLAADADEARRFYTSLFPWGAVDMPIGDGMVYTMLEMDSQAVGAMFQLPEQLQQQGIPSHWMCYIAVDDLDASVEKAQSLGAQLVAGPMDVFDAGRMAQIQDPTGARVSLWQAKAHIGAQRIRESGAMAWTELMTHDVQRAAAFYGEMFGWTAQSAPFENVEYTCFMAGEAMVAGMMAIQPQMGPVPPNWLVYFGVDDCDGFVGLATERGANVLCPPTDIPGGCRFAVLQDPQDAVFAVIKSEPME